MKTSKLQARKDLVINGDLLDVVLKGAIILEHEFTGWDWFVLVKLSTPTNDGFSYAQFETVNDVFHLMVQRNGTKAQVIRKFLTDYHDTRQVKNKAFELGNIA